MTTKRDYYEVLGVTKGASKEEIEKAYRKKAKQFHPDISKEENAEAKFKEVQEAYETLGNEKKRSNYDQFGHSADQFNQSGFGGFEGFGGFDDIINSFFGGGASRRTRSRDYNAPMRGDDIEKTMNIDFLEAALGVKKNIKVEIEENCSHCDGTGAKSKSDVKICSRCHGSGFINVEQRSIFGVTMTQMACPVCNGTGKEIKNKCDKCFGKGRVRNIKNVDVNIPAGIDSNMTLRVAGYGHGGIRGGNAGDLLITFNVRPHRIFERKDNDIYLKIPISYAESVLGVSKEVPTIYGDISIKIPPGTDQGTNLRIKEKGIASVRNKKKGDQIVVVELKAPKKISAKEKKLYENIAELEKKENESMWSKFKSLFK